MDLSSVSALRPAARTRSISPENPTGEVGGGARATTGTGADAARDLGRGWKVSPSVDVGPGETYDLAVIDGTGTITHLWATAHTDHWRSLLLRAYWDGADEPAIEVPYGDFFCSGWGRFAQVSSQPIAVNPNGGFNSYWPMPFRTGARLTVENLAAAPVRIYYQVTYELDDDAADRGYLHAQWRRSNPLGDREPHVIIERVRGRATTSAPTWPGALMRPAGGARVRSSSISTTIPTSRRSAAPAPRTTWAAPGTSMCRVRATRLTARPIWVCRR